MSEYKDNEVCKPLVKPSFNDASSAMTQEAEACNLGSYKPGKFEKKAEGEYLEFDWAKNDISKKLIFEKKHGIEKDVDFAPLPMLTPVAERIMDRVDSNQDGAMSSREIDAALRGNDLDEKEKHMLKVFKENKDIINDSIHDGITICDLKEFDNKVTRYEKELAMSRKFAPELADLARELHLKGKLADGNHDGKFSHDELVSFYKECKDNFLEKPTIEGERELEALQWGISNHGRYAQMTGRPGGGQITLDVLHRSMLSEMDREAPSELRQNFLSQSDRRRVERYVRSL